MATTKERERLLFAQTRSRSSASARNDAGQIINSPEAASAAGRKSEIYPDDVLGRIRKRKISESDLISVTPSGRVTGIISGRTISYKVIEAMNQDPIIAFCRNMITSIVCSLGYSVNSTDEFQKQLVDYALKNNYKQLLDGLCTAFYNGFAFGQKRWEKKKVKFETQTTDDDGDEVITELYFGKIDHIKNVKFISPINSLTYYIHKEDETITMVTQRRPDGKYICVNREDLIWFASGSPFDTVFGRSRYMDIMSQYEIGVVINRYYLEAGDKSTIDEVEIRYPEGFTNSTGNEQKTNREIANEILEKAIESFAVSLPSTRDDKGNLLWEIKKRDPSKVSTDFLFEFLRFTNLMKCIGLGIPSGMSPIAVSDRSQGVGESQKASEFLMFMLETFVSGIEEAILNDFITDIIEMNVPNNKIKEIEFKIDRSMFNKKELFKEIVTLMIRMSSQMVSQGKGIPATMPDMKAIFNQLNIPYDTFGSQFNKFDFMPEEASNEPGLVDQQIQDDKDNDENRVTDRDSEAKSVIE